MSSSAARFRPEVGRSILRETLTRKLRGLRPRPSKVLVVMDRNAVPTVGARVERAIRDAGLEMVQVTAPHGEKRKRLESVERMASRLVRRGADRGSFLLAVGGGVTSDMAGLVASLLFRGVPWGVVPTTLLAMADASVGGKTAVNLEEGKNLLGTFHFPRFVICDVRMLASLPPREWACGMGEVLKTAMLSGPVMLQQLESTPRAKLRRGGDAMAEIVRSCTRYKARIVAQDPKEGHLRKLLNLGHTFGHALETAAGPRRLAHGEAVALGIRCALADSLERGLCREDYATRIHALSDKLGLPDAYPGKLPERGELRRLLLRDKKAARGLLDLILPIRAGHNVIVPEVAAKDAVAVMRRTLG